MRSTAQLALASLLLLGCGEIAETRLVVRVESAYAVPAELDRVEIEVDSTAVGGAVQRAEVELGPETGNALPARLGLSHAGGAAPFGPFRVVARGFAGEERTLVDEVRREDVMFVRNEEREVVLWLGEVADAGMGDAGVDDAGMNDAGAPDAGAPDSGSMCLLPEIDCGGTCRNGQTDRRHCGGCDNDCNDQRALLNASSTACLAGVCASTSCDGDWLDCDADPTNGCETDKQTDVSHCGGCNQDCARQVGGVPPSDLFCDDGNCSYFGACAPGFLDCDGERDNGCECDATVNRCASESCVPR